MKITQKNIFPSQLVDNLVCLSFDKDSFNVNSFAQYNQPQPSRLKKAVVKRQAEYLAGRICASQALKAIGYSDAIVETSENRAPIWPDKTLGAITHTKGIAMAVALHSHKAKGIGIDVEKHMSAEQEIQLQNHILIEDEYVVFNKLGELIPCPLTVIFSAKESIFKALYPSVRTFFGFEKAKIIRHDHETLDFQITSYLSDSVPVNTELQVHYKINDDLVFSECIFQ